MTNVYFIARTCVYKNENVGEQYWTRMQYIEPCPRFAHQLVYDEKKKAIIIFIFVSFFLGWFHQHVHI